VSFFDLTPDRISRFGWAFFAVYGGMTGGFVGTGTGTFASLAGYDKRFPWLLRLGVVVVSAACAAINIPFTLPREFFEPIP
jgi:hypothetical protein